MNPTSSGDAIPRFQPYKTAIGLCLVAAAIYVWWPHRTFAPANPVRPRPFTANQFTADTEQAWMARLIGHDLLEMVAYASTHKHPANVGLKFESGTTFDGKKHRFTASFAGMAEKQQIISVDDYFWSPAAFAPWASALLNTAHPQIANTSDQSNAEFITLLTHPMPETLIREDKRLSTALTENPLDPELHEEAALLIGSFAMRESAGSTFCDIRRHLCKMTAHLALAKAVRQNPGACGTLAEAILCSLTGRETPAFALLDQLQQKAAAGQDIPAKAIAIWNRALHLYNTGDYRQLEEPEKASLLERLEYVRALHMFVGNAPASKWIINHDLERVPEWGEQILLDEISVEDGNTWAKDTFELELEAIATHYRDYFGKQIETDALVDPLNIEWKQFSQDELAHPTLHVLGWGAWAEQHQRQVCELIRTLSYWLGELLGLPEAEKQFEQTITAQFGSLQLFPFIRFYNHPDDDNKKLWIERTRKTVADHRDWITYHQWSRAWEENQKLSPPVVVPADSSNRRHRKMRPQEMEQQRVARAPKPDPLLSTSIWFTPRLPFGTLFDLYSRGGRYALLNSSLGEIEAAKAMAPSNRGAIWAQLLRNTNSKPTPEQTDAAFSALTGYDVWAMKFVADAFRGDPVRYAEKFGAICWFEPDRYVDLANYLFEHGNETGAAQAFQNAFDHATDRVHVSNTMDWLVNYYFEHNKKEEAYKIAQDDADVYSQAGLVVFANLLDRMGQIENAEWYFQKAFDRYPDSSKDDLLDFYARHRDKSSAYAAEEKKFRALLFPAGVEQVALTDFRDRPKDGATLTKSSPRTDKAGLHTSDVIVGVNGCRIHNIYQYYAARAPSTNPNVKFILWRDGKYVEVDSFFPKQTDFSRMISHKARPGDR